MPEDGEKLVLPAVRRLLRLLRAFALGDIRRGAEDAVDRSARGARLDAKIVPARDAAGHDLNLPSGGPTGLEDAPLDGQDRLRILDAFE